MNRNAPVFIENRGQFDDRVKFRVVGNGNSLWLTEEGITFDFERAEDKQRPNISGLAAKPSKMVALDLERLRRTANPHPTKLKRIVFSQKLVGADANPRIEPKDPVPGSYNYFIGAEPVRWRTNVRGYREVVYHDIWRRIDLRLYANGANLEQEFIVHPGADPTQVRVAYDGIRNVDIAEDGSLKIRTKFGDLTETKPRIYQVIAGNRVPLDGHFKVNARNSYTFDVSSWSGDSDLVIDPTLLYSTFLGGSAGVGCGNPPFGGCGVSDVAYGIAVDASGSAYVTGVTASPDFPITPGAFQNANTGECAFVAKLSPLGDRLEYSTYLGPGSNLSSNGIAVNSAGEAYITGAAQAGFPTTSNALNPTFNGGVFITKLSAKGDALLYSTQWGRDFGGGGAGGEAIAIDSAGRAFVTGFINNGYSADTTPGAFQSGVPGGRAAFFAVLDPTQSGTASLIYGTCLGGSGVDHGRGIAVDAYGMAYITGDASSTNFPTTTGAYQTTYAGGDDAFVAKFNPNASGAASLLYSTYLGGGDEDVGYGIAADTLGNAYIAGFTESGKNNSISFPTTPGAVQTTYPVGDFSGFVTKLNTAGNQLVFSTYHGGVQGYATSVAVDVFGDAYVAGSGGGGLPVTADAFQPVFKGGNFASNTDAFLTKFNPDGGLIYSSYLGGTGADGAYGVAIDSAGDAYLTGYTTSIDFPSTPFAFQPAINTGGSQAPDDVFLTKFPFGPSGALSINRILPNNGGNAGTASPQIFGSGFHIGASVKLVNGTGAQVSGQQVSVDAGGTVITTTFDLHGISPGSWDLVITNPDGAHTTLSQAFTVVQGGTTDVWVSLVGFPKIRSGRPQAYAIAYGNRGGVDAGQTRFWITFPSFLTWQPATGQTPGSIGQMNGNMFIAFDVPLVRAGSRSTIPIILSAPNSSDFAHRSFEVQVWKDAH